jgi:hypothetical protein
MSAALSDRFCKNKGSKACKAPPLLPHGYTRKDEPFQVQGVASMLTGATSVNQNIVECTGVDADELVGPGTDVGLYFVAPEIYVSVFLP